MPYAAVELVRVAADHECFYRSVLAALRDIGHYQSIFTVRRLRQLVHEFCQSNARRGPRARRRTDKVQIGATPLLEHLQAQHMTLSDLAFRTTLSGTAGWAGIEEAAVLASKLTVVIEIWMASPHRSGYVLWFRTIGASSKATGVARLYYNGTDHYDFLRVRPAAGQVVTPVAAQAADPVAGPVDSGAVDAVREVEDYIHRVKREAEFNLEVAEAVRQADAQELDARAGREAQRGQALLPRRLGRALP